MRRLSTRNTPFQRVEVWGTPEETEFRVTGAIHAWWHERRFLAGLAWDAIAAGLLSHPVRPRRVLMLGLGGGTSLRTLRFFEPGAEITAVEIDPEMIDLARRHMRLDDLKINVVAGDAYAWLRANRRKFDVIFDDVYGVTEKDVERPLASLETLLPAIRRSLARDGLFGANLVTGAGHRRVQSAFRKFFTAHFPEVRSITTPESLNECLIGGAALRPWREVRALAARFPGDSDYTFWRLLRARRLKEAS